MEPWMWQADRAGSTNNNHLSIRAWHTKLAWKDCSSLFARRLTPIIDRDGARSPMMCVLRAASYFSSSSTSKNRIHDDLYADSSPCAFARQTWTHLWNISPLSLILLCTIGHDTKRFQYSQISIKMQNSSISEKSTLSTPLQSPNVQKWLNAWYLLL